MKEVNDIIKAYDLAVNAGKRTALATVVHVEGSSYRRPGARMLVTEDGMLTGAISGGCLEGDALRKALLAINENKNKLVTYDTTDEDDAKFGVQLGCNGIVHILFEPIDAERMNNPLQLLKRLVGQRQTAILVSVFSLENRSIQPGLCFLAVGGETWKNAAPEIDPAVVQDLEAEILTVQNTLLPAVKQYDNGLTAFLEVLPPPISMVICGAGNDAVPLMEAGHLIGMDITVIDGRQTHATTQRFPKAKNVIVSKAAQALEHTIIDDRTAWVLMTHNYNYDLEVLAQLLETSCTYIGILGPKKKLQRMLDELLAKGTELTAGKLGKIYGPVGLDIGAETAEEIAISITAEVKAIFSGRKGQLLRDKQEAIHNRQEQVSLKT
jgi:xanthine/CO dehydrogenase XdhC/CoxF family maturation factor